MQYGPTGPIGRTPAASTSPAPSPVGPPREPLPPNRSSRSRFARDPNNVGLLQQQAAYDPFCPGRVPATPPRPRERTRARRSSRRSLAGFYNDLTSTVSTIASIQAAGTSKAAAAARTAALHLPGHVGGSGATSLSRFNAIHLPGAVGGSGGYSGQFNVPPGLQVDLAREQATGRSMTATLKAVRAAAWKALRTEKLAWDQRKAAYDAITEVNQQLASSAKAATDTFRQQRRRAVALAGAQGLGYQYAYAAGPTIHIEHFHSNASSPKALEEELARRANARAHVRRGAR